MSHDYQPNTTGFEAFNARQATRLGWGIALGLVAHRKIATTTPELEGLAGALAAHGCASDAFGVAVEAYQVAQGLTADRKLGAATWKKLVGDQQAAASEHRYLDISGRLRLAEHVQVGGLAVAVDSGIPAAFRPKPLSNFNPATARPRRKIILHWGGWNVASCHASLENDGLSTHFMVSPYPDPESHLLSIYQGVDLAFTAHHAAGVNDHAIGIDICRTPLVAFASRYPDATIIDNPSHPQRGERQVLDLPVRVAAATRALAEWVAQLFDIPVGPYPGDAVIADIEGATGILGHHHVSPRKWDVAPWAPKLWRAA